jgi:hypothetical protein
MKIELKWALRFHVALLVWMALERISGLHDKYLDYHFYLTNLFFIPAVWIIVHALKEKRKVAYFGTMYYSEGLLSGLLLTGLITVLTPASQWIISYIITPEYFNNVIPNSVEAGFFPSIAEAEAHFTFKNYVIGGVISWVATGVLTSAIAMIFLRYKPVNTVVELD